MRGEVSIAKWHLLQKSAHEVALACLHEAVDLDELSFLWLVRNG